MCAFYESEKWDARMFLLGNTAARQAVPPQCSAESISGRAPFYAVYTLQNIQKHLVRIFEHSEHIIRVKKVEFELKFAQEQAMAATGPHRPPGPAPSQGSPRSRGHSSLQQEEHRAEVNPEDGGRAASRGDVVSTIRFLDVATKERNRRDREKAQRRAMKVKAQQKKREEALVDAKISNVTSVGDSFTSLASKSPRQSRTGSRSLSVGTYSFGDA